MSKMIADILSVEMLETSEAFAVEENQYSYDLCIRKPTRLIAMRFAITYLMFFEFKRKIHAEVIGKTENFSNFVLGNHIGKYLYIL